MTGTRPIRPLDLPDVARKPITSFVPTISLVEPTDLHVDETYQRGLSERSMKLIRRIVNGWDWRAFKPPIVVEVDGRLHVVDGQHTAIAAATRGDVSPIPVMIVEADGREDRALAFVKHNRDRIAATPNQMHHALVAAGDEDALTLQQVCERAGARIVRYPPGEGLWKVGDTLAVTTLREVVNRRHAKGARQVMQVCVEGEQAPISAAAMKAVEELLFGPDYAGQVTPEALALVLREKADFCDREARRFAAEHNLPVWRGLVASLLKHARGGSRARRS